RTEVVKLLQEAEKKNSLEAAQKAKIKWAIEGDENSKYYHGVINKKRNQLSIRGILVEGTWIDSSSLCGIAKSPGPDGFTFGFYRRYWKLIENDVVDAVTCFFHQGSFPKGVNSYFIILNPKTPNANMVKDYRPICLIRSMYKIISKILANRLVVVLAGLVNEIQSAFVADKLILDGPFIFNELVQWCKKKKKQSLAFKVDWRMTRGSVIMNGSPTEEFQFYKGRKQGDPLSPFLFILVMKSLHISFQRVVDVGLLKGIELAPSLNLSHTFYTNDAIFIVPKKVLHRMESMRSYFFNGAELSSKNSVWVKWKHALSSKDKGGLGVSSLFALNREGLVLLSLVMVDIIHEVEMFKSRGINLQFEHMKEKVDGCILVDMMDRWFWALEGSGEFTVTSVKKRIDDFMLPEVSSKTRWIKAVPIKVNVHAWKVKLDGLPTRLNISRRGEGRCGGGRFDGGEGEGGVESRLRSGLEMVVAVGSGLEMAGDGQRWCGGWRNGWVVGEMVGK
nr:RNA-directed DNA polymerase, eukaryota, reverse transcriptase zinc-binding domain protein [Tanacetum cinerariifolium]